MQDAVKSIEGHVVILGWSERVPRIIAELRNEVHAITGGSQPILILAEEYEEREVKRHDRVYFVYGDPKNKAELARLNLEKASMVLIPVAHADTRAADGDALFAMFAALSVCPSVRVCVEVGKSASGLAISEVHRAGVLQGNIEVVPFESIAERLLAQAAVNRGVTRVYDHLLSFSPGSNEIYVTILPGHWAGATFGRLAMACFPRNTIVIGYERETELFLNPPRENKLVAGDHVWYIAFNKAEGVAAVSEARP